MSDGFDKLCIELGSDFPVQFLKPEPFGMIDSDGNQVFCKCGNPATLCIIGNEDSIYMCYECFFEKD